MKTNTLMAPILLVLISSLLSLLSSSFQPSYGLIKGSSLMVEKTEDRLISPNGEFTAGFYLVGDNAYCFAIWFNFNESLNDGHYTIVWMANRDQPVDGKHSKLSLLKNGNLILTDADQFKVWETRTVSDSSVELQLNNKGNLVLVGSNSKVLWQSFDSPTDTLLPDQLLTKDTKLVSARSRANYSSGFYTLHFDDQNVLRLVFDGYGVSSAYWPATWQKIWEVGRSDYNNTRIAFLNSSGGFTSTDDFKFLASDYGDGIKRRLTLDVDGNVRLYSRDENSSTWKVSFQAISQPCTIHGICGPNSLCIYTPQEGSGRKCTCLPGYKLKNDEDWSFGCQPQRGLSCNETGEATFLPLPNVVIYGCGTHYYKNYTYKMCKNECLSLCDCQGFQFNFNKDTGVHDCFIKSFLLSGQRSPGFPHDTYVKLHRASLSSNQLPIQKFQDLSCALGHSSFTVSRPYKKPKENRTLRFVVCFAYVFGGVEIICFCLVFYFLYRTRPKPIEATQRHIQVATGFKRFTYYELKKATSNFKEEIGRGGGGVVYKGVLSDNRVAAIKRLKEANKGETEFLAEVSTIGRVNHMNLIKIWGYCAQEKHRLLIYEFMEHGSLKENLSSNTLDSEKRFEIAIGTAKGLAYLHEECLEWVLHCDVKPQNILLDNDYQPKVSDFGLSKLLNRGCGGGGYNSSFSRVRGTRGYMAPEWILNLSITAKVDVYSYGVVVLEMVTGKCVMTAPQTSKNEEKGGLVKWVREKMSTTASKASRIAEIIDPRMQGGYNVARMAKLVEVALQCVEEDKEARPTMKQVVEMLLHHEDCH